MTDDRAPAVVVLGGPNGAGKSTAAPRLLRGSLRVDEFVNADTVAQGLSAFRNFFVLYRPQADAWRFYDASATAGPRPVATGGRRAPTTVRDQRTWRSAVQEYVNE